MKEAQAAANGARRPWRVGIVDDHELARAGLRSILVGERDVEVVGEAADGRAALELCRRQHPDLLLMDVRMPGMDGLAATRQIKEHFPDISVVIITMHENPDYLVEALKAGAAGYVLKDSSRGEILRAVRLVLRGDSPLDASLTAQLLRRLADERRTPAVPTPGRLTPREREVLALLTEGRTNREIAEVLVISPGTAKLHVERIIGKLGVSDRTQAAVRAVQLGLVGSS